MPYVDSDRGRSWELLARHAARPQDSWVEFAHRESVLEPVEAILCVAETELDATDFDPNFQCELHRRDVLLFLRSECPTGLSIALEMQIRGERGGWELVKDGHPVNGVCHEVLPPQVSETFRRGKAGYEPLLFRAVPKEAPDDDHVLVSARMVVDTPSLLVPRTSSEGNQSVGHGIWATVNCCLGAC